MTGEIQRELEATRQELRRGAVDLPRETSEQAAAMRRVVAEQIKALNELTEMVTRSGRDYDVAEPAARPDRQPAAPRTGRSRPGSRPARRRASISRPPAPRAPSRRRPRSAPAPAPARAMERGGWMSDLLARASVDEPRPSRARTPGRSLDSLSAEIARVVDENALVDAWDRFRRGDRTAFDRRLYTAQGEKTFEDVRRRYAPKSDFRRHGRPLPAGIRTPARRSQPRRPRRSPDALLSRLGNR